jgi:CDP-diacylglycerol--glycerol-3-phosphate 3-phosphatidyltransferase
MLDVLIARPIGRARDSLARWLAQAGVGPNVLTLLGTLLQCSVAWLFYRGYWTAGGTLLLFSSSFDMLDGAVAKVSGRATRFGAFLDSTMDRVSDMALFAGLVAYYADAQQRFLSVLAFYCLAHAILISYTKARAENLIPDCTVGLAQRPERLILLIAASLCHCIPTGLSFIAFYSTLTTLQRILHTHSVSKGQEPGLGPLGPAVFLDFGRKSVPYDVLAVVTLGTMIFQGLRG